METIGFIGSGNMAEALINAVTSSGLFEPRHILASDVRPERLDAVAKKYGVTTCHSNAELAGKVGILVLSVKPQDMDGALQSIKTAVRPDALLVSIAAGIRVSRITAVLGDVAVVRVMPNTPALIGEGASALFANERAKTKLDKVRRIFSAAGKAVVVDDEDLIDVVTAVSGSGPAYYFLLIEEMINAAVKLGLPEDVAKDLVLQTAKGAALLAVEADKNGEKPAGLRRKVTSPGGTTAAALKVLADGGFGSLVAAAIERARDRSKELSGPAIQR